MRRNNGTDQAGQDLVRRALKGPHRRHKRYRTQSLLIDNPVVGRVVNVGQSGFAIESPEGLSVGQSYVFKVRLGDRHLRLAGRVQWCRLTTTESNGSEESLPVYRTGIALAETVTCKAWQKAMKRLTEEPAHIIWHRARQKTSVDPMAAARARGTADPADRQIAS